MQTLTKSPTWTSISPRSFKNSVASITLSDLRPALTTTKSESMETTSAVITSPERISWRARLSSNNAAKLSPIGAVEVETLAIKRYLSNPTVQWGKLKKLRVLGTRKTKLFRTKERFYNKTII